MCGRGGGYAEPKRGGRSGSAGGGGGGAGKSGGPSFDKQLDDEIPF